MKLFKLMETAYENFDETVKTYVAKVLNTLNIENSDSQIFNAIFTGVKGVIQNAMFYIEDALTEQNIFTAARKKSVYSLAKISGFEPSYGTAASGTIIGTLEINNGMDSIESKLYIMNNAIVKNVNTGLEYVIQLPNDYYIFDVSKSLVTQEFKIVEGTFSKSTYTAAGEPLETIQVSSISKFDRSYLSVYVNGIKYEEVGNLYEMREWGKQYVCSIGFNNTFNIMFGDGVFGRQLYAGDVVTVYYLLHNGLAGNIYSNDSSYFTFVSGVINSKGEKINGNDYIKLELFNTISGGTNEDSIALVKSMIGYHSRSNILMTEDNFKLFLSRFSFIGSSNVWLEKESLILNIAPISNKALTYYDTELYFSLKDEDFYLSENEKEIIYDSLVNNNKCFNGLTINIIDPILRKYAVVCYVKVSTTYNKDIIKDKIKNSIVNYFLYLRDNVDFIPKSDIIKTVIDDVPELLSFDFDFISKLTEDCYKRGYYYKYELRIVNNQYKYVPIKVYYEKNKQPGLDNFGNIVIDSEMEIPLLRGNFNYYSDKNDKYKNSIMINEPVQVYFVD